MPRPQDVRRTARLDLRPLRPADTDALFAITSDPATWRHAPQSRHTRPEQTAQWIERACRRWRADRLSYWLVRLRADDRVVGAVGAVIGVGGVQRQSTGNWNLYYRLAPAAWGHGYATELGRAALEAAHDTDNGVPVLAWVSPDNPASANVARRLGMIEHGLHIDPSDGKARLAFADRPVGDLGAQPCDPDGTVGW